MIWVKGSDASSDGHNGRMDADDRTAELARISGALGKTIAGVRRLAARGDVGADPFQRAPPSRGTSRHRARDTGGRAGPRRTGTRVCARDRQRADPARAIARRTGITVAALRSRRRRRLPCARRDRRAMRERRDHWAGRRSALHRRFVRALAAARSHSRRDARMRGHEMPLLRFPRPMRGRRRRTVCRVIRLEAVSERDVLGRVRRSRVSGR